jgi:arginyl-tRNA synthetase
VFNRFYHDCKIVTCEDEQLKKSRLALTKAANQVLKTALHLICMQSPEKI